MRQLGFEVAPTWANFLYCDLSQAAEALRRRRPDALRLGFEPRLRRGKDRRRVTAALHRDHLARKLSVPLFVFSGGNLLPNCGRSRIAMDQTAAARCTGCPVAARESRSPAQGPPHTLASR